MKIPCVKDCPDRTPECHADCERYAKYAAWRETIRQKRAEKSRAIAEKPGMRRAEKQIMLRQKQGRCR